MTLRKKTILILSPQSWGKMFISKHHYAITLARRGNEVYFLNPPQRDRNKQREVMTFSAAEGIANLFIIEHRLQFNYNLKFRAIAVFHWLMKFHLRKILKQIGRPVDIVWSFDLGNIYPLTAFDKEIFKIFHPVDQPQNKSVLKASFGADVIFSVTKEILSKYNPGSVPMYLINHGVSNDFLINKSKINPDIKNRIHVGYSGNLLHPDIDRDVLLQIVKENSALIFEFFGSFSPEQSNIGGEIDHQTEQFLNALKQSENVVLHGAVTTRDLVKHFEGIDVFLICYDPQQSQSGGTNSHKILEYLSTGKVIVSSNMTAYKSHPDLMQMVQERENQNLPTLFKAVVSDLNRFNSPEMQIRRIEFARDNSYERQVDRIDQVITGLLRGREGNGPNTS